MHPHYVPVTFHYSPVHLFGYQPFLLTQARKGLVEVIQSAQDSQLSKYLTSRSAIFALRMTGLMTVDSIVASAFLSVYDSALIFDREKEYIWMKPWSITRMLYLLNRYGMILFSAYFNLGKLHLLKGWKCLTTVSILSYYHRSLVLE